MNQDVLDRVLGSPRLPSLPTIALEVIELAEQQHVNIDRIADMIRHDPALSSKILKTVNNVIADTDRVVRDLIRESSGVELTYEDVVCFDYHLCRDARGNRIDEEGWRRVHAELTRR